MNAGTRGEEIEVGHGIRYRKILSTEIPTIDFSPMLSPRIEERRKIVPSLTKACTEVGFFYLANHGFPQTVINRAYQAMQKFFALPRAEKIKIHYQKSKMHRGFVGGGDITSDYMIDKKSGGNLRGRDMHEAVELAHDLRPMTPTT